MIQTTLIPDNTVIKVTIPANYVGKKMHALFYIDDEIVPQDILDKISTTDISNSSPVLLLLQKKLVHWLKV